MEVLYPSKDFDLFSLMGRGLSSVFRYKHHIAFFEKKDTFLVFGMQNNSMSSAFTGNWVGWCNDTPVH
jgi:hypothetical protein